MLRTTILSATLLALAAGHASADHNWVHTQQREQAHQMYLTPGEHQALHRGTGYGYGYGNSFAQPSYGVPMSGYGYSGSSYWTGSPAALPYTSPAAGCARGGYYGGGFGW